MYCLLDRIIKRPNLTCSLLKFGKADTVEGMEKFVVKEERMVEDYLQNFG